MTLERKLIVGFDEIKAIVFECNGCKIRTVIPIEKYEGPPTTCPHNHRWNTEKPVLDKHAPFYTLAILLKAFTSDNFSEQCGFKVFLEFEEVKP